jgi:hypothetical protein
VLHLKNERLTSQKMIDMKTIVKIQEKPKHEAKLPVIKSACKKDKCKNWNGLFNRCKFVNADCCQAVL